jgi:hypothetical protein
VSRPEREQRTQSVDGKKIDAAQVDVQYAAVPYQPSGVRAHAVYVGRVDLAADGDHGAIVIVADPDTGPVAIDDRAVSTWRMVNAIVPNSHVQAFAGLAPSGGMAEHIKGVWKPDAFEGAAQKAVAPTLGLNLRRTYPKHHTFGTVFGIFL